MIIGSVSENKDIEKRISITPELVKRRGRVYIINKNNPKFKARQK